MVEKENAMSPIGIVNGPTQEEIDGWKERYGDIYVASFGPEDKYIYRPMNRLEYKQIMTVSQNNDNKMFMEEKVVSSCVVWPKIDVTKLPTSKAGTVSTLVELIMAASNFGIEEAPIKL